MIRHLSMRSSGYYSDDNILPLVLIGEFEVGGQWGNLWKFAANIDNSDVEIVINTNDNGVMTQTVTKK